jgi:hypothetical protein
MAVAGAVAAIQPAAAATMKECGTMYKAAKADGTLNGMTWTDFRKAKCGAAATPAAAHPAKGGDAAAGHAVFPTVVSPKYAKQKPGAARMHTCLDQYNENKKGAGNGGMKWIQKGGGYYSACNRRLKG